MTGIESHQLNPSVEQPVLLDGDEAGHLPGELEGVLAGHHSVVVKESRSGPSVYFNIFPIIVPRLLLTPSFSLISLVAAEPVGRHAGRLGRDSYSRRFFALRRGAGCGAVPSWRLGGRRESFFGQ